MKSPGPLTELEDRKDAHLRICLDEPVERPGPSTGFERYRFEHDALPELRLEDVDVSCTVLGRRLHAPLMIGAMTGGTRLAGEVNRALSRAAQTCGVGLALGSQRKMLESPETASSFQVRDLAPDVLLVGNIGAVQLNYGVSAADVCGLSRDVGADAMAFHLNPLQEAIQPEGDTDFRGLVRKLGEVVPALPVPVLVKEVGAGLSRRTLEKLALLPIAGVETAGAGGTSWARIETYRTASGTRRETGQSLAGWGVPTVESLLSAVELFGDRLVVCSGGIRTGLDVAKAVAMGAHIVASALPFLRAAVDGGHEAVAARIRQIVDELRTVCFLTGSSDLSELRRQRLVEVRP